MKKQEDEKLAEIIEAEKVAKKGIMTILSKRFAWCLNFVVIDNFQRVSKVLMDRELALKGIVATKVTTISNFFHE